MHPTCSTNTLRTFFTSLRSKAGVAKMSKKYHLTEPQLHSLNTYMFMYVPAASPAPQSRNCLCYAHADLSVLLALQCPGQVRAPILGEPAGIK